ncbi:hypothetical protein GCM10023216_02030 [Isoptericola chiayiensis]|uniref:FG-GAP repeat protein n=1 Tax=Isoptericola chiayiensis TaxID=579446 RepID=A0ABP8XYX4_9MICO|nr:rhamnogalacturonan lyase [Isoptericola chiayiensis]NOW01234.1 hypothetical protein [Isoptericola chiayiensis]
MPRRRTTWLAATAAACTLIVPTGAAVAAHPSHSGSDDAVQLEDLDRGLVAVATDEGNYLGWRLLGTEVTGATSDGMTGADFAVYRDGDRIATVTDSTNYLDADGDAGSRYRVVPVVDGKEQRRDRSAVVTPWGQDHRAIAMNKPADGVTPVGEEYTYSANDLSVADLDGDDELELVVQWDPSNSKDVSQKGYTGNTYLDAYEMDGTQLWRIDLGVNIRSGAHYTQFPVYDFDGDGRAEVMVKTAPGTKSTRYTPSGREAATKYVSIPRDDRAAGVTHDDDYRMSADDYFEHVVDMFEGWTENPEVASGQWPATLKDAFADAMPGIDDPDSENYLEDFEYPLSEADARATAEYFVDVYAPARSGRNDLRTFEGFIISGPEYLSVFDGKSGKPLETVDYTPARYDDGLRWGDYAMSRIEPGNRVDRFLAGVSYLDGEHPSAVFARGYYTRTTLVAYDWDGRELTQRWDVDSGWTPMDNPFNDGPHGTPGTDPEFGQITTQGQHSMSSADLDGDGKQEILYGAAAIDHDGSLLWNATAEMPPQSADPGAIAGLGHGDAMHVTDILPERPGLEAFMVHEGGAWAPFGTSLLDAATGEVLEGVYSGRDTGRGMIGDVRPDVPGIEMWSSMPGGTDASGLLDSDWNTVSAAAPGNNQSVRWAADGTTQIFDYDRVSNDVREWTPKIVDWASGTERVLEGTLTNNDTKGNAGLIADVLGDWREEILVRSVDSSEVRLYTSTEVTDIKMYTLLHDPQYRAEVARQQTAYNQPSYPGFYLASDTDYTQVPLPPNAG